MTANATVAGLVGDALRMHANKSYRFPVLQRRLTYGQVEAQASRLARSLVSRGLQPQERVALLFGTSPEFLVSFVGVLAAGGACVPLPHSSGVRALDAYISRLARILASADVRFLFAGDGFEDYAAQLVSLRGLPVQVLRVGQLLEERAGDPLPIAVDPAGLALIQYTSGSTSEPKGVALTHANVAAGLRAIVEGTRLNADDVNGQWLPLHHDMGLIGMLAGTLAGVEHHLWAPQAFIRAPGKWLAEFARCGATIYAGPNFSFKSIVSKVSENDLAGLDLSRWRIAFNGAEMIDPRVVEAFTRRFEPYGFRPATMFPVYGLAEATLAATFPEVGSPPHIEWVDRDALANDRAVQRAQPEAPHARGMVGVGGAVLGHAVRVVGENDQPLDERTVGEIELRGPAVMQSYLGMTSEDSGITRDGWLHTGDIGFVDGGRLYVTGRQKEMIIVRGANYYPHDVESIVGATPGVYQGRAVAFSVSDGHGERIAILAEAEPSAADLDDRIRERVLAELGLTALEVHLVKPRAIQRTTSGKYQRLLMRDRLLSGDLGEALISPSAAVTSAT